jgi:hypothetical protein
LADDRMQERVDPASHGGFGRRQLVAVLHNASANPRPNAANDRAAERAETDCLRGRTARSARRTRSRSCRSRAGCGRTAAAATTREASEVVVVS